MANMEPGHSSYVLKVKDFYINGWIEWIVGFNNSNFYLEPSTSILQVKQLEKGEATRRKVFGLFPSPEAA